METIVYLIRHGQAIGNEEGRYIGQSDVPLSEEGLIQIQRLALNLREIVRRRGNSRPDGITPRSARGNIENLAAFYSSDLSRAHQSATLLAAPFDLRPATLPALRELHFGRWEGQTPEEIRKAHRDEYEAWMSNPFGIRPPGGESAADVRRRVLPVFADLLKKHHGRQVAIVAHAGVNRIILCEALKVDLRYLFRLGQDPGGLSILVYYGETPVVETLNCTYSCSPLAAHDNSLSIK